MVALERNRAAAVLVRERVAVEQNLEVRHRCREHDSSIVVLEHVELHADVAQAHALDYVRVAELGRVVDDERMRKRTLLASDGRVELQPDGGRFHVRAAGVSERDVTEHRGVGLPRVELGTLVREPDEFNAVLLADYRGIRLGNPDGQDFGHVVDVARVLLGLGMRAHEEAGDGAAGDFEFRQEAGLLLADEREGDCLVRHEQVGIGHFPDGGLCAVGDGEVLDLEFGAVDDEARPVDDAVRHDFAERRPQAQIVVPRIVLDEAREGDRMVDRVETVGLLAGVRDGRRFIDDPVAARADDRQREVRGELEVHSWNGELGEFGVANDVRPGAALVAFGGREERRGDVEHGGLVRLAVGGDHGEVPGTLDVRSPVVGAGILVVLRRGRADDGDGDCGAGLVGDGQELVERGDGARNRARVPFRVWLDRVEFEVRGGLRHGLGFEAAIDRSALERDGERVRGGEPGAGERPSHDEGAVRRRELLGEVGGTEHRRDTVGDDGELERVVGLRLHVGDSEGDFDVAVPRVELADMVERKGEVQLDERVDAIRVWTGDGVAVRGRRERAAFRNLELDARPGDFLEVVGIGDERDDYGVRVVRVVFRVLRRGADALGQRSRPSGHDERGVGRRIVGVLLDERPGAGGVRLPGDFAGLGVVGDGGDSGRACHGDGRTGLVRDGEDVAEIVDRARRGVSIPREPGRGDDRLGGVDLALDRCADERQREDVAGLVLRVFARRPDDGVGAVGCAGDRRDFSLDDFAGRVAARELERVAGHVVQVGERIGERHLVVPGIFLTRCADSNLLFDLLGAVDFVLLAVPVVLDAFIDNLDAALRHDARDGEAVCADEVVARPGDFVELCLAVDNPVLACFRLRETGFGGELERSVALRLVSERLGQRPVAAYGRVPAELAARLVGGVALHNLGAVRGGDGDGRAGLVGDGQHLARVVDGARILLLVFHGVERELRGLALEGLPREEAVHRLAVDGEAEEVVRVETDAAFLREVRIPDYGVVAVHERDFIDRRGVGVRDRAVLEDFLPDEVGFVLRLVLHVPDEVRDIHAVGPRVFLADRLDSGVDVCIDEFVDVGARGRPIVGDALVAGRDGDGARVGDGEVVHEVDVRPRDFREFLGGMDDVDAAVVGALVEGD